MGLRLWSAVNNASDEREFTTRYRGAAAALQDDGAEDPGGQGE